MKERTALAAYIVIVILVTSVHELWFLLGVLPAALLLAARERWKIARKAALAILLFNSIVTVSYTVVSIAQGSFSPRYVALINCRVFLLTYLTFLLGERVNLFKALAFSPTLTYLLTLAYSQSLSFRRLVEDFRLARRSRSLERLSAGDLYRHGGATVSFLMDKAMADATLITRAMKSRGFFSD